MNRDEVLNHQIAGKPVRYLDTEYYVHWLTPPKQKPAIANIGRTKNFSIKSTGERIGDTFLINVEVSELSKNPEL